MRNIEQWKYITKRRRNVGHEYTTYTKIQRKASEMDKGCGKWCRKKCHNAYTDEKGQCMFRDYWNTAK